MVIVSWTFCKKNKKKELCLILLFSLNRCLFFFIITSYSLNCFFFLFKALCHACFRHMRLYVCLSVFICKYYQCRAQLWLLCTLSTSVSLTSHSSAAVLVCLGASQQPNENTTVNPSKLQLLGKHIFLLFGASSK